MIQVLWDVTASLGKGFEPTMGNANIGPQSRRPGALKLQGFNLKFKEFKTLLLVECYVTNYKCTVMLKIL